MTPDSIPPLGRSNPLVPPLFQSSVYTLPDLESLDAIMDGQAPGFIYARDAHPNARYLAERLTALESGTWTAVCGSGMGAITAIVVAVLQAGDRIVASNRLYGKTTQLLLNEFSRFGVKTTLVDTCDLTQVEEALQTPVRLLFVETLSNPLLRAADLEQLSVIAHRRGALLVVDNTFATPSLIRPLELGTDIVMESLTKMIGGHSDITLGSVSGRDDLITTLGPVVSTWGLSANPFDCWLAARGLTTLDLRMTQASANAFQLAQWLHGHPKVVRVVYPGLADHPDHALTKRLFDGKFGNMLCFEVEGGRAGVNLFLQQAPGIPFSPSLGHTSTTLSHPATTSHRYVSPAERKRQSITDGLIRLSVGIESLEQIKGMMAAGLG